MLAVILTLLIGGLCGIDLYLKSYIETHYKEGEEKKIFGDRISVRKVHNKGMACCIMFFCFGRKADGCAKKELHLPLQEE